MLIKYLLNTLPHRSHCMVRPVECNAVGKDGPDIMNKLFCVVIPRVVRIRVRFRRIGSSQFPLNGREIHRVFYDGEVVGNVKSNRVDGSQEGTGVFGFFERAHGRLTEAVLWDAEGGRA